MAGVPTQYDSQADGATVLDYLVQALKRRQVSEVRVRLVRDTLGLGSVAEHIIGEWDSYAVESQALHLAQDGFVASGPQPLWNV